MNAHVQDLLLQLTGQEGQKAFTALYKTFFTPLFRFAQSLTGSPEASEEIVNDIFMKLWNKREVLSGIRDLNIYLFVAVKNRALDHCRKEQRHENISIEEIGEVRLQFSTDPEQLLITSELTRKIEAAIRQLPPRAGLVFMLIKQYGLKYKEVAHVLGLSVKTVENQLAIAIRKLTKTISFVLEDDR